MIDLRQIVILRAIHIEGSIAGAARSLHFGQPTITYHLDRLERVLETKMVVRGPRGAMLTAAGTLFLEHGERILALVDEATAAAKSLAPERPLRIGTFQSAGALLLAPIVAAGRRSGSICSPIALLHGSLQEHLANLRQRMSDCAIVYSFEPLDERNTEGLQPQLLASDPYRVIVHRGHPLAAANRKLSFEELAGEKWITRSRDGEADDLALAHASARSNFTPQVLLQEDDYSVATAFLSDEGAIFVPKLNQISMRDLVELKLDEDLGARHIYFVTRPGECVGERATIQTQLQRRLQTLLRS